MREKLKAHLEWAEGRRSYPYEDSVGKLSIGVGRNLDDRGLRDDEIDLMLDNDMTEAINEAGRLPYFHELNEARQIVVADMVFNLGLSRFRGFIRTNERLVEGNYAAAADEMLDSKWARQVGRRAVKLADAMRSGEWT